MSVGFSKLGHGAGQFAARLRWCERGETLDFGDIRSNVDHYASRIPGLVDIESSLEVHGTAENSTVAMNVTKQASWVGYIILGIALASVAGPGTAVDIKWISNVDGLRSWLSTTHYSFVRGHSTTSMSCSSGRIPEEEGCSSQ